MILLSTYKFPSPKPFIMMFFGIVFFWIKVSFKGHGHSEHIPDIWKKCLILSFEQVLKMYPTNKCQANGIQAKIILERERSLRT